MTISDSSPTPESPRTTLPEHLFPTLTPQQISRIAAIGRRRSTTRGEVLVDVGDRVVPFFVILSDAIQALRPFVGAEALNATLRTGQFSGEGALITGRRSMAQLRVREPGQVIELSREQLLALVQTDAELSEILMRAFVLPRVELIARDLGDVVVIGSTHSAGTLRVKEFLARNGHPFHYVDLDRDRTAQELFDRFQVTVNDVPVLICRGTAALRNPTNAQIADCLGFNADIDESRVNDALIVGAGPAVHRLQGRRFRCGCAARSWDSPRWSGSGGVVRRATWRRARSTTCS